MWSHHSLHAVCNTTSPHTYMANIVHEGRAASKWKGAAVFAEGLAAAVDSGMGSITNIFGIQHYLN